MWGKRARDNQGPEITKGSRGARQKDAAEMQKRKGTAKEWETTENGLGRETPMGSKDEIVGWRLELEGNTKGGNRPIHNRGWRPRSLGNRNLI